MNFSYFYVEMSTSNTSLIELLPLIPPADELQRRANTAGLRSELCRLNGMLDAKNSQQQTFMVFTTTLAAVDSIESILIMRHYNVEKYKNQLVIRWNGANELPKTAGPAAEKPPREQFGADTGRFTPTKTKSYQDTLEQCYANAYDEPEDDEMAQILERNAAYGAPRGSSA